MKIELTKAELEAALWAIGQMTIGNANDIREMMSCGISGIEARSLLRAEGKMKACMQAAERRALLRAVRHP